MPPARSLTTAGLLRARASARFGLLASATATVAVAVATVCTLLAWLVVEVGRAGDAALPGVAPDEVAAQVDRGVVALVSAAPALVLLVVILAATAAAQLAILLAAARTQERLTTRARGLSRAQATMIDAVEAAGVAVGGGVVGLVVAAATSAAVAWLAQGESASPAGAALAVLTLWWAAAVTAALLGVVLVVAARRRSSAGTRGARATTAAAVSIVVLAAAFAVWQLPLARPTGFDPVVAVAPTVVLMAAAILVLAVFGAGAAAATIPAAARRTLTPAYPARQVARRLPIYAVAVLLVGLTVAQAVFASTYSATWTAMATQSAALRAGADLRVDMQPSSASAERVAEVAELGGVTAAAPALAASAELGSTVADLIAVPADAIDTVVVGSPAERAALQDAVGGDPAVAGDPVEAMPLGDEATGLRVAVRITAAESGPTGVPQFSATVLDATGTAETIRLARSVADVTTEVFTDGVLEMTVEGALPAGTAPWRLEAVTAEFAASYFVPSVVVEIAAVDAIGGDALPMTGAASLSAETPAQHLWIAGGIPADPVPVPVMASAALAERLGVAVGDELEFRYEGTGRRGEIVVAGIADVIPGAAGELALFADLDSLQLSMLQRGASIVPANSIWAAGDPAAAAEVSSALGDRPVATASPGVTAGVVGALVPGWWIATAGSAVLALIAAFAIVQTLSLARRRELGVLRAVGVTHRAQARTRAAELSAVLGSALVLGAAAGLLVAWLIVPALVGAVTPGILSLDGTISFAWPGLLVALGGLALGLAAIVLAAAAGVRRAARAATVGEDAR